MFSPDTITRLQERTNQTFSAATHTDLYAGGLREPRGDEGMFVLAGRRTTAPSDIPTFDILVGTIGDLQPLEVIDIEEIPIMGGSTLVIGARRDVSGEEQIYELLLPGNNYEHVMLTKTTGLRRDGYLNEPLTHVTAITLQT